METTCFHSCTELGCLESWGCPAGGGSHSFSHLPSPFTIFHSACGVFSLFLEDFSKNSSCQCIQGHFYTTLLLTWHFQADGDSEHHPHSASHSQIAAEMLDLPLEQGSWTAQISQLDASLLPVPSTGAALGLGQAGTAQHRALGHCLSVFVLKWKVRTHCGKPENAGKQRWKHSLRQSEGG